MAEPAPTPPAPTPPAPAPEPGKELADLKASNAALMARLDALEKKPAPADDPDLAAKAKAAQDAKDKASGDTKAIENALKFSLSAKDWLKTNASLLPKNIQGIFDEAEKERYENAIEKDSAIKSSVIQSFFNVQENLDLLTPSQKSALEDFQKLTKNGKQEKAQNFYETIFEPTFESLKRIKKAEQLGKQGHSTATDVEQAYKDRLMKGSKKHYLNEKDA